MERVSIQQPLIDRMYGGKTPAEMVALVIDAPDKKAYDIVRKYWLAQMGGKDAEKAWRKALNDGVVAAAKPAEGAKVSIDAKKLAAALAAEPKALQAPVSKSPSFRAHRPGTAGLPTTDGCRKRPIRFQS